MIKTNKRILDKNLIFGRFLLEYVTVTERPIKERNCFDEDNIVDLTVNKNAEAKKPIGTEWKYLDYRVTKTNNNRVDEREICKKFPMFDQSTSFSLP